MTAFKFTVASGVMVWLYSLLVLIFPAVTTGKHIFGADIVNVVKTGNRIAFLWAYTGAVACSAISSDLTNFDCTNAYCSKVIGKKNSIVRSSSDSTPWQITAACVFMWFTSIALLVSVIDHDTDYIEKYT